MRVCAACLPRVGAPAGGCCRRLARAARTTLAEPSNSRYTLASAVYLSYALLIVMIDVYGFGGLYGTGVVASMYGAGGAAAGAAGSTAAAMAGTAAAQAVLAFSSDPLAANASALLAAALEAETSALAYEGSAENLVAAALFSSEPGNLLYTAPRNMAYWPTAYVNQLYLASAIIHFVNAWQYVGAWFNRYIWEIVLLPE